MAATGLALAMWVSHIVFEANIFAPYADATKAGDDCEYATGVWSPSDTFDTVRLRTHVYTPLPMPFRSATRKPEVVENGYLITRCRLDLSSLPQQGYAWLIPGILFGSSAVWLNGSLKTLTEGKTFLELALTPSERSKGADLLIVSRRDELYVTAGLASLAPVAFGAGRALADRILGISTRLWVELPMARANFCLGLLVVFAVTWLAGMRYQDVGWMVAFLSVLAAVNAVDYYVEVMSMAWVRTLQIVAYIPLTLALVAFAFAFLRIHLRQRTVELTLVAATCAYALLHYATRDANLIHLNTSLRLFWGFSAAGLTLAALLGLRGLKALKGRRRLRVLIACGLYLLVAALFVYLIAVLDTHALLIGNVAVIGIATGFTIFLALDLVVFKRQYFEERDLRAKTATEVRRLQDKLTLGGAIQALLLPDGAEQNLGSLRVECRYHPHESLAGDWYYYWTHAATTTVLLGDVTGKGPSAALAVAAIMTLLYDARASGLSASSCIERLDAMLRGMFRGHLLSTLVAIEATADGQARFCVFGAEGVFLLGGDKPLFLASRAAPLGAGEAVEQKWQAVQVEPGQALVALTDGYLEGSQLARALLKRLASESPHRFDLDAVVRHAENLRMERRIEDDRTIVALSRPRDARSLQSEASA